MFGGLKKNVYLCSVEELKNRRKTLMELTSGCTANYLIVDGTELNETNKKAKEE